MGPKPLIGIDSGSQEVKVIRIVESKSHFEVLDYFNQSNSEEIQEIFVYNGWIRRYNEPSTLFLHNYDPLALRKYS